MFALIHFKISNNNKHLKVIYLDNYVYKRYKIKFNIKKVHILLINYAICID